MAITTRPLWLGIPNHLRHTDPGEVIAAFASPGCKLHRILRNSYACELRASWLHRDGPLEGDDALITLLTTLERYGVYVVVRFGVLGEIGRLSWDRDLHAMGRVDEALLHLPVEGPRKRLHGMVVESLFSGRSDEDRENDNYRRGTSYVERARDAAFAYNDAKRRLNMDGRRFRLHLSDTYKEHDVDGGETRYDWNAAWDAWMAASAKYKVQAGHVLLTIDDARMDDKANDLVPPLKDIAAANARPGFCPINDRHGYQQHHETLITQTMAIASRLHPEPWRLRCDSWNRPLAVPNFMAFIFNVTEQLAALGQSRVFS